MKPSGEPPLVLALDDQLCLALYTASRAMTARYRALLEPLGLTYPQYLVLLVLWQEGPTTVGGIGGRIHLESSTLSPLIKRLETMQLVRRHRDTADERTVVVELTPDGVAMELRAAPIPGEVNTAVGMSDSKRSELVETLRELADRLSLPPGH
jgi:MarR family transcriptional regulator, organic hydroperoxide resistance regulator